MTAIIYNFDRSVPGDSQIDETERLFAALERYTVAELLELLYVGEEPGFFELMRGLFGLSDENRLALQNFLCNAPRQSVSVTVDPDGKKFVLTHGTSKKESPISPIKGIVR